MNPERKQTTPDFDIEDYVDTPYYSLLHQLPNTLATRHIKFAEAKQMNEHETMNYLTSIIEARHEAMIQYEISDEQLAKLSNEEKEEFFKQLQFGFHGTSDRALLSLQLDQELAIQPGPRCGMWVAIGKLVCTDASIDCNLLDSFNLSFFLPPGAFFFDGIGQVEIQVGFFWRRAP